MIHATEMQKASITHVLLPIDWGRRQHWSSVHPDVCTKGWRQAESTAWNNNNGTWTRNLMIWNHTLYQIELCCYHTLEAGRMPKKASFVPNHSTPISIDTHRSHIVHCFTIIDNNVGFYVKTGLRLRASQHRHDSTLDTWLCKLLQCCLQRMS